MSKAYLCELCRWYGGYFVFDKAHLCNAPDASGIMDERVVVEVGQDEPSDRCRHYTRVMRGSKIANYRPV